METLKEGFLRKNLGLGKDELIKNWLGEHKIKNYTINDDWTIDVKGYVGLGWYKEEQLPDYIQFRKVSWDFYCMFSNLSSLKGCPEEVGGKFDCQYCRNLESLEGAPQEVGGSFHCNNCVNLKSLKGCPKEVGEDFNCINCISLTSLNGAPEKVGRDFLCYDCGDGLETFTENDVKKVCKVKRYIINF